MVHIRKRSHPHPTNFHPMPNACRLGCNLNWVAQQAAHGKGCTSIIRLIEKNPAPLRLPNFSSFFLNHSFFGTFRAPQLVKMFFPINSIFVEPYDCCKWSYGAPINGLIHGQLVNYIVFFNPGVYGPLLITYNWFFGDPPCSRNKSHEPFSFGRKVGLNALMLWTTAMKVWLGKEGIHERWWITTIVTVEALIWNLRVNLFFS